MRWFERILMVLFGAFFAYGFVLALICIGAVFYVLGSTLIFGPSEKGTPTASASVQPVMQLNERAERLRAALMDTQSKVRQVLLNTAKGKSGLARDYLCAGVSLVDGCSLLTITAVTEYQLIQAGQCMDGLDYDRVVLQYSPAIGCGGN